MPARLSSMELSPASNPERDSGARPSRRKSGRVTKKPELLSPSTTTGSGKRKRAGDEGDASDNDGDSASAGVGGTDGESDEEEVRQRRKKAHGRDAKSAAKRPKTNGAKMKLAIRPAGVKKKKLRNQAQAQDVTAKEVGALYGTRNSPCTCGAQSLIEP